MKYWDKDTIKREAEWVELSPEQFINLIDPYHDSLAEWVELSPEQFINLIDSYHDSLGTIMDKIKTRSAQGLLTAISRFHLVFIGDKPPQ